MKKVSLALAVMALFSLNFAQTKDQPAAEPKDAQQGSIDSLKEQVGNVKGQVDGINESYLETKATVDGLAKLKLSGYIQAQMNIADTANVLTSSQPLAQSRFLIKRGRIKALYETGIAQYCLQLDAVESGVSIKDAYVRFTDPWLKAISFQAGSQLQPFGFECPQSSAERESPEFSRVIGTALFPKQYDLGAILEIAPPEGSPLDFLNIKGGFFNGTLNNLEENDNYKDFIGRLGVDFPLRDLGLSISGGVSTYMGLVSCTDTSTVTTYGTNGSGLPDTIHQQLGYHYVMSSVGGTNSWVKTANDSLHQAFPRQYTGGDVQLSYATPYIGGTCIRGEFVGGKQPSTSGNSVFYDGGAQGGVPSKDAVYLRNFMGYYVYFIQNIDPASLQLVVKYDYYDPNTDATKSDFTSSSGLTTADIPYSTIGLGVNYFVPWATNVRLTAYYDIIQNEKLDPATTQASLAKFENVVNANVWTLRAQFQF